MAPTPRLSVAEWADEYRKLAKGFGAFSGQWETAKFEISRGPMLAMTEPGVHLITIMCCTQLMKTEFILNAVGYLTHIDPSPVLKKPQLPAGQAASDTAALSASILAHSSG